MNFCKNAKSRMGGGQRGWGREQPQQAVHSVAPEDQNLFLKFKFKLARCLVPGGTRATLSTLEFDET